jgi:hypothetical protein
VNANVVEIKVQATPILIRTLQEHSYTAFKQQCGSFRVEKVEEQFSVKDKK